MYCDTMRAQTPCGVYMLSRPYLHQWQPAAIDDIEMCTRVQTARQPVELVYARTWGDVFASLWSDILSVFTFRF